MQKIKKTILNNGLRVVTIPMKENPTVTVMLMVNTGADFENNENNGIAHFLEHLCFKGTKKRLSSKIISTELDMLGAHYNAYTDREITNYYAKVSAKDWKKAYDVITDIVINSSFPSAEMEKEKGVIIEEMNMYEDMPERKVWEVLAEAFYDDQIAGRRIIGSRENIQKMNRDDIDKFHKEHYVPGKMTLVVSGGIKEKEVLDIAKKTLGSLPQNKIFKRIKTIQNQKSPKIKIHNKKSDQMHMIIGFRTMPIDNIYSATLSVISGILGVGMSSRFFIKLREELGVAYYVYTTNEYNTDRGFFAIACGVANDRTKEVVVEILKEIKKISTVLVDEKELQKVKQYLIGSLKLSLESSDSLASYYGPQEVLKGRWKTPEDRAKAINNVTAKDIQKIAQKFFTKDNITVAMVGGEEYTKDMTSILKL